MAGTLEGGRKAAATKQNSAGCRLFCANRRKGGRRGHTGGFSALSREELSKLGAKGGKKSRRGKSLTEEAKAAIYEDYRTGLFMNKEIAARHGISVQTVSRVVQKLAPF